MSIRARVIALIGALAAAGYAIASWRLFDLISASVPHCGTGRDGGPRFRGDTPARFGTDGLPPELGGLVETATFWMPDYRTVTVRARDGVDLAAWWVPGPRPDSPAVVMAHGIGSCRRDPVMLLPAGMLHRRGFAALLLDLRGQGDSAVGDGRFTGGVRERLDVLGGWDWVRSTGLSSERIGLFGESNGAATVLLAAAAEPAVAAVWSDSSYADPWVAVREEIRRRGFPEILIPGAAVWGRLAGIDLDHARPIDAMAAIGPRPVMLVHGAGDTRFDPHHALDLAAALSAARGSTGGPPVEPWIVPGADHLRESFVAADEYERRLAAVFGAALGGPLGGSAGPSVGGSEP
jgi:dipeptidyl aminopeptidase/acylaminoacyl peptidase